MEVLEKVFAHDVDEVREDLPELVVETVFGMDQRALAGEKVLESRRRFDVGEVVVEATIRCQLQALAKDFSKDRAKQDVDATEQWKVCSHCCVVISAGLAFVVKAAHWSVS